MWERGKYYGVEGETVSRIKSASEKGGVILNKGQGISLIGNVIYEQRLERGEGVNHVQIWGKHRERMEQPILSPECVCCVQGIARSAFSYNSYDWGVK